MIEALKDFPDNVIAIACHGHVTRADYETVLVPDIEDKLSRHKRCGSTGGAAIPTRSRRGLGGYEGWLQPPPRLGTRRDGH